MPTSSRRTANPRSEVAIEDYLKHLVSNGEGDLGTVRLRRSVLWSAIRVIPDYHSQEQVDDYCASLPPGSWRWQFRRYWSEFGEWLSVRLPDVRRIAHPSPARRGRPSGREGPIPWQVRAAIAVLAARHPALALSQARWSDWQKGRIRPGIPGGRFLALACMLSPDAAAKENSRFSANILRMVAKRPLPRVWGADECYSPLDSKGIAAWETIRGWAAAGAGAPATNSPFLPVRPGSVIPLSAPMIRLIRRKYGGGA